MKYLNAIISTMLITMLSTTGCSDSSKSTPVATQKESAATGALETEHAHGSGPNGGVVFDLGSYHAEFTVDHGQQQCKVLLLGDDEKTPSAVTATELILNIEETKTADGTDVSPMTITMTPENEVNGKASKFVGSDPGIGNVADFAGTVSGEIDGKPAMGEFKE